MVFLGYVPVYGQYVYYFLDLTAWRWEIIVIFSLRIRGGDYCFSHLISFIPIASLGL